MIEVAGLTKRFGELVAVDDLSFTAPAGQVTALLGPNGAGKTTTFRVLLGLAHPTAGQALIDGRPYAELAHPRQSVGAVLESSGFHQARTGRDHLRVVAIAAGIPGGRVEELLGFVGLARAADRGVGGYSTGMRQRLALASALLGNPRVLVLDEPTGGLDPEGVAWMRRLLRELAAEGRCVLIASHLLAEVAQAADRVVIIARGRALREADVSSLDGAAELEQLYLSLTAGSKVGAPA
jgi:ABC-2 type transport system ATP-binding protein